MTGLKKLLAVLSLVFLGCCGAPPVSQSDTPVTQFYLADLSARSAVLDAMSEWATFGFVFTVSNEKPNSEHFSEIEITDSICTPWSNVPSNAVGCVYGVRATPDGLLLDSAMTARARGDAIAYHIDIRTGVDIRREVLHELGHVAGFCHVDAATIMNACVNVTQHLVPEDLSNPCDL